MNRTEAIQYANRLRNEEPNLIIPEKALFNLAKAFLAEVEAREKAEKLLGHLPASNPAPRFCDGCYDCWNTHSVIYNLRQSQKADQSQLAQAIEALKFYATFSPRQHPEGFYEIHIAPGEGGEVRFGTKARATLTSLRIEARRE